MAFLRRTRKSPLKTATCFWPLQEPVLVPRGWQVHRRSTSHLTKGAQSGYPLSTFGYKRLSLPPLSLSTPNSENLYPILVDLVSFISSMVDYPRLPTVESGSESGESSASRQNGKALKVKSKPRYESEKGSGDDSDQEVHELSRLLENFGGKSNKNSSKDSGKESDRESAKKSDKELGNKSNKNSGKNSDNSDEISGGSDDRSDNAQNLRRAKGIIQRLGLNSSKGPGEESGKKSDKERGRNSDDPSKKNGKGFEHERSQKSRTSRKEDQSDDATEQGTPSGKTTKPNATNGKQMSEDESPVERKKATHYTKEQRDELTRVRKCREKDYYGILGLEENCSKNEIRKAYRKLSIITHPDRNYFRDAKQVFQS
jgi:hypothetical protein